ncbi:protein kinase [bacterium]|nr:protein kinase [bacterium]
MRAAGKGDPAVPLAPAGPRQARSSAPEIPGLSIHGEPLGSGSGGTVYRARELATKRDVAVKWLPNLAGSNERARFDHEVRAAAGLRHEHIATIFGAGELAGGCYIIMELVLGASLAELFERRAIGPNGLAILAAKVARALDVAHRAGIVHRDVKPSLAYMSPEVASGDAATAGPPSDVFSLGCIVYEGLSGKPPFEGESAPDTIRRIQAGVVEPLPPGSPPALVSACLAALARSPDDRPRAVELAERLEAAATVTRDAATHETAEAARAVHASSSAGDDRTSIDREAPSSWRGSPPPRAASTGEGSADERTSLEVVRARAQPRNVFGPFVLLSELGKGGMGLVHRAWDDRAKRLVALKMLSLRNGAGGAQAVKRFQREAEAIARLRHPNIVPLFEVGELSGKHFLAMELIEGQSLEQRLRPAVGAQDETAPADSPTQQPRRIPLMDALRALRDAARALHYAHEQGVVHRDVKPANIMLDRDERAHVLDFGVATVEDAKTKLTRAGGRVGTLAYMSPEQSAGQATDARTDVYSLGATLYDVLANRPPFVSDSELALLAMLASSEPDAPGSLNPRARGDLEVICLKCLEKEPARRYPTAAALADDLDRYLAGEPIQARPLSSFSRIWRKAKRNKLLAALVVLAAGGLVVAVLLGGVALHAASLERERLVARARADAASSSRAFGDARAGAKASATETPGEKLARLRPLIAQGLRARDASERLAMLVPDDARARKEAFDIGCALGDLAREAGEWDLAARAFESALALGVDDALMRKRLEAVASERASIDRQHGKEVEQILKDAASGDLAERPSGREDAVFALVRLAEPKTVALLASALDGLTKELEAKRTLDKGKALVARIACEALGRIGIRERAVDALGRFLAAETDELRAIDAGIALLRLGGGAAQGHVVRSGRRIVRAGGHEFWRQMMPFLGEIDERALDSLVEECWKDIDPYLGKKSVSQKDARALVALSLKVLGHKATRNVDAEIADHTKEIEIFPDVPALWCNRAMARASKGDIEGALADCSRGLELDPRYAHGWYVRGLAKYYKSDVPGSIAAYTRAIELDATNLAAWVNRGHVRFESGDFQGALADASRAIELDPHFVQAWDNRADARLMTGDNDGAIADARKALELDPRFGDVWRIRGLALAKKGDVYAAIKDLERFLELEPMHREAPAVRDILSTLRTR